MFQYPLIPTITVSMLSPIQEETAELLLTLTPDIIYDIKQANTEHIEYEQRNNNTPLEETAKPSTGDETLSQMGYVRRSKSPKMMSDVQLQDVTASRPRIEIVRSMESVRKPEAEVVVEVLKQKYINNDIRDLPCGTLKGPIRYGRLHRSRPHHLNLASQDIRSQMNKLRFRVGSNPNASNPRMQFRYSRLGSFCNTSNANLKTLEELLNGDLEADDYDPELAQLFDDYVEICDKTTRGDFNSRTCVIRPTERKPEKRDSQSADIETKEAFWRGFMEGMNHSKHQHSGESEALNQAIAIKGDPREASEDPCIDKTSHTDMIRNNQDITHKFLKEWENIKSTSLTSYVKDSTSECFACNTEQKKLTDLLSTNVESSCRHNPEGMQDKAENKNTAQKDVFHLDKSTPGLYPEENKRLLNNKTITLNKLNPVASEVKSSSKGQRESKPDTRRGLLKYTQWKKPEECRPLDLEQIDPKDDERRYNRASVLSKTNAVLPAISKHQRIEDGVKSEKSWSILNDSDRALCGTPVKLSEKRPKYKSIKIKEEDMSLTPGPFMVLRDDAFAEREISLSKTGRSSRKNTALKDDMSVEKCQNKWGKAVEKLSRIKNALDDSVYKEYQFRDENINIITLAKIKLENKSMSSLDLEDMTRSRTDWVGEQSSTRFKSEERAVGKERKMIKDILSDLDFDGWESNNKPFNEQDTLHMSSSELLHPVDSFESFSSPSYSRKHNSTPVLTILDVDKKVPILRSNEGTHVVGSRTITPDRGTPTTAKLSDLEDGKASRGFNEITAFKPINRKKNASERVTLRLTKSCDSFVAKNGKYKDPAFDNIPLARCVSYNIQQKIKSGITQAANINLSETLAQQLNELGKDKDTLKKTTQREPMPEEYSEHDTNDVKRMSSDLPLLDGKKFTIRRSQSRQSPESTKKDVILPDIDTCNPQKDTVSAVQSTHMVCDTSPINTKLPSISGIPLLTPGGNLPMVKPIPDIHSSKILQFDGGTELWMQKSFPCRSESLQSPYTFDKADSPRLMMRARALPHLHSVCTSCGDINEHHENTSGHERTPSRGKTVKCKGKGVHHRCSSPDNDEKWKLEKNQFIEYNDLHTNGEPDENHLILGSSKKALKKTKNSTNYSKHERTRKKSGDDAMTFRCLDQKINLRFELKIPNEEKVKIMESLQVTTNTPSPLSSRMEDIARPHNREMLECPFARETRIYKEKNRQKQLVQNGDIRKVNSSVTSPYIEYCKRRAHILSSKGNTKRDSYIDIWDVEDNANWSKEAKDCKEQFRSLPAKSKKKMKQSPKAVKSHRGKQRNSASEKKGGLLIEPCPLPVIATEESPRTDGKSTATRKIQNDLKTGGTPKTLHHIIENHKLTVDLPIADNEICNQDKEHKL